jgi:hypothetical protein
VTIIDTPVISNSRASHLKQPRPLVRRATLEVKTGYGLEKNLCRQILSVLLVPHISVDIAVNQVKLLLRKKLSVRFF